MARNVVNYSSLELLLMIGTGALLFILFAEVLDVGRWFRRKPCTPEPPPKRTRAFVYGYDETNGPADWRDHYLAAKGARQSPINIMRSQASCCRCNPTILWSPEYAAMPTSMRLHNDGHTVILIPGYPRHSPTIQGGPLETEYELSNIRFRWGACDDEGSEHTIENYPFALEMQALHIRNDATPDGATPDGMLFVTYLFQITASDNPYMEPVIHALPSIRCPGSTCSLGLFPINWLMPPFSNNFYMYIGSLTYPPCSEGVKWIVQPEPLLISSRQVRKFRKVCSATGPLHTNSRPLQKLNARPVCFYSK